MASTGSNPQHPGVVNDHSPDVISSAGVLEQIHADVHQLTQRLASHFAGHGAIGFFEAQSQMLSGLRGLIEVVRHHDATIESALEGTASTDQTIQ